LQHHAEPSHVAFLLTLLAAKLVSGQMDRVLPAVADDDDRDLAARLRAELREELLLAADAAAIDGQNLVASPQAGLRRGGALLHVANGQGLALLLLVEADSQPFATASALAAQLALVTELIAAALVTILIAAGLAILTARLLTLGLLTLIAAVLLARLIARAVLAGAVGGLVAAPLLIGPLLISLRRWFGLIALGGLVAAGRGVIATGRSVTPLRPLLLGCGRRQRQGGARDGYRH
jgi:hypothetical protein